MTIVHVGNRKFMASATQENQAFFNGGKFDPRKMLVVNIFELVKVPNREYPHPLRRAEGIAINNPLDANNDRKALHLGMQRALDYLASDPYAGVELTDDLRKEFHSSIDSSFNQ